LPSIAMQSTIDTLPQVAGYGVGAVAGHGSAAGGVKEYRLASAAHPAYRVAGASAYRRLRVNQAWTAGGATAETASSAVRSAEAR